MQPLHPTTYINQASNVVDLESLYIFLDIAMTYHPIITTGLGICAVTVGVIAYYASKQYINRRIYKEDVTQHGV